ncbi:MAG: MBL fold metallo-hydrolase [Deltaproteobacteria bacterium]
MLIRQLVDPGSWTFTYLLADPDSKAAVLIDPVLEQFLRDLAIVRELGLDLLYTIETHAHADHVTAAWRFKQKLGSRIVVSKASGAEGADRVVEHGDVIEFGAQRLEIRATPGHTSGCVTFVTPDRTMAFTGDALMVRGTGRTDFQEGDAGQLFRSVRDEILSLPDTCRLYPAHDYQGRTETTVAEERAFNPRVGDDKKEEDFVGYMRNLGLPHPRKIDVAVPANLKCGRLDDDPIREPTWGPLVRTVAGVWEVEANWVAENRSALHVIDVRSAEEFDGELGHVPDAQLVPLDDLTDRLDAVPRDRPVIAVCQSGARSSKATAILEKAGFDRVANLSGGMLRWRQLGLPVDGGAD